MNKMIPFPTKVVFEKTPKENVKTKLLSGASSFFKKISNFFPGWGERFSDEELQYPCRIFALDTYTCCYGCIIQRSGKIDDGIDKAGDTVLWVSQSQVKSNPNAYFSKHFRSF